MARGLYRNGNVKPASGACMIASLVLVAALLQTATPAPMPTPTPNPYQIYREALAHLYTLPQPDYIVDTQHWLSSTLYDGGATNENVWDQRTVFDSRNHLECNLRVPYSPSEAPGIGESYFPPDVWLINRRTPTAQAADNPNMAPDLSDLKTIASVISVAKPSYDIRLVGIDNLTRNGLAYHLLLRPLSDPVKHNLRELWIKTNSYDIVRAVIEGSYRPNYNLILQDTLVFEDFGQIGPYWLVTHKVWSYPYAFSHNTFRYEVTSTAMQFPATLPDWFFDSATFMRHSREVNALLGTP